MHPKLSLLIGMFLLAIRVIAQPAQPSIRELDSMYQLSQRPTGGISQQSIPGMIGAHPSFAAPLFPAVLPGLVAKSQSQACYDTAYRSILRNDTATFHSREPSLTADGNLLVSGQFVSSIPPYRSQGFLMKTDYRGNVFWMKTYDSLQHSKYFFINFYRSLELQDGSIFLVGATNNLNTNNNDIILARVDATGNLMWSKVFKCKYWTNGSGSSDYYVGQDVKQDPSTGDVFICGHLWSKGRTIMKVDISNGNIIWSTAYNQGQSGTDRAFGMHIKQNEIVYFGKLSTSFKNYVNIYRINKSTGQVIQTKTLETNDPLGSAVEFLGTQVVEVTGNGHYFLTGSTYGFTQQHHGAVLELDSNLNFVSAYTFKGNYNSSLSYAKVRVFPDGTGFASFMKFISAFTSDMVFVQFANEQILNRRVRHYTNEGIPYEPLAVKTNTGGDLTVRLLGDSVAGMNRTEFLELYPTDSASQCFGMKDTLTSIYPIVYSPINFMYFFQTDNNVFTETYPRTITAVANNATRYGGCIQTSFCDSLSLHPSATTVCVNSFIDVKVRKNSECGSEAIFNWPSSAPINAVHLNDSTTRLTFTAPWTGTISASLQSCQTVADSFVASALAVAAPLQLGTDTVICPANTLLLNAHSGYASYLWQNGSTDSILTVVQPGSYWVQVTDACGGSYSDTVHVTAHPPIPFSLGPDRSKCNNDTLHLQAPPGFLNYNWKNNYNISSTAAQNVIVYPSVDTSYYVKAEKSPGCFAYDTIRITVNHSPAIKLGNDTSFCSGEFITADAGSGFSSYAWNTGQFTQQITIASAGSYNVLGTATNGCKSRDTLVVSKVWPLPLVQLDPSTELCAGSTRLLHAGNFNSYLWNDGSTGQQLAVSGLGQYFVSVIDANGCRGADTVSITSINYGPAGFLPADTSLCEFASLYINPLNSFSSYQWSTGAATQGITVNRPGLYWLQATDNKGCIGRDSLNIVAKECMKGVYLPNAFSPDNNGRNDVFRALVFEHVSGFRLNVYNRWGALIYSSTDPAKGWDGTLQGKHLPSSVFTWTCSYVADGKNVMQKGTVLLIR